MSAFEKVKQALVDDVDYDGIKNLLRGMSPHSLKGTDEDGLDLLHHAVLSNNSDGLRLLLLKNIFTETEPPELCPYLHLAAAAGNPTIVNILLQERPNDLKFKCELRKFSETMRVLINRNNLPNNSNTNNISEHQVQMSVNSLQDDLPLSAVDIAAYKENLKCVELLLNSKSFESSKFNILECAIEMQSIYAVKLLLKQSDVSSPEIARAFKRALLWKLGSFVDVLLTFSNKTTRDQCVIALNGMNPYHVMFMYSSAFQIHGETDRFNGLKETTEALAKHDFDINQSSPLGSYPLYSLLCSLISECVQYPKVRPHHHYRTLKFLLDAGTETNFVEEDSATVLSGSSQTTDILFDIKNSAACGRALYKSSVEAITKEISMNHVMYQEQVLFIEECLNLLFKFNAKIETEALCQSIVALAFQHSHKDILDFSGIFQFFLKHGADSNYFQLLHPLNVLPNEDIISKQTVHLPSLYFFELLRLSKEEPVNFEIIKLNKGIDQCINLLRYMNLASTAMAIHEIEDIFRNEMSGDIYEYVLKPNCELEHFFSHVESHLNVISESVEDLAFMCKKVIWNAVQRKHNKLLQLEVPQNLKISVLNMFC